LGFISKDFEIKFHTQREFFQDRLGDWLNLSAYSNSNYASVYRLDQLLNSSQIAIKNRYLLTCTYTDESYQLNIQSGINHLTKSAFSSVQSINNNTKLLNWKSLSWQRLDIAQHQNGESSMSSRDWQPNGVDVNQPEKCFHHR
jgi:hypothetical protein